MTTNEFYKKYDEHTGDNPTRQALRYDGYKLTYKNGDEFTHTQELKAGAKPSTYSGSYFSDDFNYRNTWNGEEIK